MTEAPLHLFIVFLRSMLDDLVLKSMSQEFLTRLEMPVSRFQHSKADLTLKETAEYPRD